MQALEAGQSLEPGAVVSNEKSEVAHDAESTSHNEVGGRPSQLQSHLKTLWLFTYSEHKTVVYPSTAFGIFAALSGSALTTDPSPQLVPILCARLPRILFWAWLNILAFTIANQRLPSSVLEDSINKPWRPLPSGRLSPLQARRLLLATIPILVVATLLLGGTTQTLIALMLTYMYNELGGADESFVIRNLINAFGLVSYAWGATEIAVGLGESSLNDDARSWLAIVGAVIATTLQLQDLRDQEGDRTRDRSTCPLKFGDARARWMCAVPLIFWSFACPAFWKLGVFGYLAPILIGIVISSRALMIRDAKADELTWKMWGLWICSIYLLPLCKDHSVFYSLLEQ